MNHLYVLDALEGDALEDEEFKKALKAGIGRWTQVLEESNMNKPTCGILAGEPEIIGERCADGGKCHHQCEAICSRKDGCVPLTASGLTDSWAAPISEDDQRILDKLEHHKKMSELSHLVPVQNQRQDSTNDQLRDLILFANRLGMYDAADVIRQMTRRG